MPRTVPTALTTHSIILKIDVKNAYNTVHREVVLKAVWRRCPEIYPLVWQNYGSATPLFIGDYNMVPDRRAAG